jgi:hypothetical protein
MALELIVISLLLGATLGLRFKVMSLVPAVFLAMLSAVMIGVAGADPIWSIIMAKIAHGTAVQFGYLAGILIRAGIAPARASSNGGHSRDWA